MKHIAYLPSSWETGGLKGFNVSNVKFKDSNSGTIIKTIIAEISLLDDRFTDYVHDLTARTGQNPLVTVESYTPTQCIKMEEAYITHIDYGKVSLIGDQLKCRYLKTNSIVVFTSASDISEDVSLYRFLDLEEE